MNIREMCPGWLFPILQRVRSIKTILQFEYDKKRIPMESNKILLFSVSRSELSGNLLYVEQAIDKEKYQLDIVLENDGTSMRELLCKMAAARYIIIDDYTKMIYPLRMRKEAKLIQVWHSTGAFKRMGFARMGRKGSTIPTSLTHRNYTDVIVSAEGVVENFEEAFGISKEKIHPIGVPRTDIFFDQEKIEEKREELYEKYPILREKKLVMFAPTFRGETRQDAHYPTSFLDIESFVRELGDGYVLGLKLHPFIETPMQIPGGVSNRVIDFSDYREINDLLFVTDLLITDYSSVIFEYAFLKKPLVFYVPDLEQYASDRDFFYPFETYTYGPVAKNQKELSQAVRDAVFDLQTYEEFYEKFLGACDGNASKRFVDTILQ